MRIPVRLFSLVLIPALAAALGAAAGAWLKPSGPPPAEASQVQADPANAHASDTAAEGADAHAETGPDAQGAPASHAPATDGPVADAPATAGDGEHPPPAAAGVSGGGGGHGGAEGSDSRFVKFPAQFFVPLVTSGHLDATMVLSITIETVSDAEERIFAQESRLRDAVLRALMIHANTGGFDGNFTADVQLSRLRTDLVKAVQRVAGTDARGILIEDIARQES